MVAIVDYGVGNLFSLRSSFAAIGAAAEVTSDIAVLDAADRIVLPGVGAFADAAERLRRSGLWDEVIRQAQSGKPLLGICLGMQLLFTQSFEFGKYAGLDLIPGDVRPISERIRPGLKIPHMGWNSLELRGGSPIFKDTPGGECVYFVHSYFADTPEEYITAVTDYGGELTAAVQRENVYGCQFHPEKSGSVGLGILKAFCEI